MAPGCQGSAASGLDAVGYNVMKPSNSPDKMCAFNHAPKNSNVGAQTQGSTSEVTLAFFPTVYKHLGLVSTTIHPAPDLCSMEEEPRLHSRRALTQEGTEPPLQPTGLYQRNLKARDNPSQSTGSHLHANLDQESCEPEVGTRSVSLPRSASI